MRTYDVVVLGGGSAAETVATTVVRAGKSVAVVEEKLVGGECPYLACMPSKAMLHSAEIRHQIATAQTAGAVSHPLSLDDGRAAYRIAAARRYEIADRLDDSARVRELLDLEGSPSIAAADASNGPAWSRLVAAASVGRIWSSPSAAQATFPRSTD